MDKCDRRRVSFRVAALAALALLPELAAAQIAAGPGVTLSTSGTSPAVAAHGGAIAVVWEDGRIRGRLFRAGAASRELNLGAVGAGLPQVAMDGDGDLVVAWQADDGAGSGIFVQRLRPGGSPRGAPVRANASTRFPQTNPRLAMAPAGSFAVGWEDVVLDAFGGRFSIGLAFFDAAGRRLGRPLQMNRPGELQLIGGVGASDSGFAAGWTKVVECVSNGGSNRSLDLTGAIARFDSQGRAWGPIDRFEGASPCAGGPAVAGVPGSDFGPLAVFEEQSSAPPRASDARPVSIQRFSPADGRRVGGRIPVFTPSANPPVPGSLACTATVCERVATVAGDRRGRVLVVWETHRLAGGESHYELLAQLYGRDGRARSPRFQVNEVPSVEPQTPAAALTADGDAHVAWSRAGGKHTNATLVLRSFELDGELVSP